MKDKLSWRESTAAQEKHYLARMSQQARCPHCHAPLGWAEEHEDNCPYPASQAGQARAISPEEYIAKHGAGMQNHARPEDAPKRVMIRRDVPMNAAERLLVAARLMTHTTEERDGDTIHHMSMGWGQLLALIFLAMFALRLVVVALGRL